MKRELQAVAIAVLASIAVGSVLMLIVGRSPAEVWWTMIVETLGDRFGLGQVLYKATGLALTGLAVALALDVGLFNIGAEAQLGAGVLACAVVGTALPVGTPAIVAIPACLVAAAGAGAAIGAAIGALRAYRGAHEVITSIMFNAIIAGVTLWLGNSYVFRAGTTTGAPIVPGAELPQLPLAGSAANAAIALAAVAVGAMWWLRERSVWGSAWRAVGRDPDAARAVGISVERVRLLAMTGSGALAGLAAANFVMGDKHAFEQGLGSGTGILGIVAALLGRVHPVGIVVASLGLGFLSAGGLAVSRLVPREVSEVLQGVVLLAVAAAVPYVQRQAASS